LFAYCGNNPVNRSDPTGHNWLDNVKKWVSDTWDGIVETVTEVVDTVVSVVNAAFTSIEASVCGGLGVYGEVNTDLGIEAGVANKSGEYTFSEDGISKSYNVTDVEIKVDVFQYEFGPHYIDYDGAKPPEFTWYKQKDTISLLGAQVFFFGGAGFEINFNYKKFIDKVVVIFEE